MRAVQGRPASPRSGFVYIESLEPPWLACAAEFAAVLFAFMFVGMEGLMLVCFCGEGLAWSRAASRGPDSLRGRESGDIRIVELCSTGMDS